MTGTDPGLGRSFRRALPRWRAGRYSLSRLFFNFYLLAMGSFVAIALIADFIISTAQRGMTDDYARRFMRGTITLVEEDLLRYPVESWHDEIRKLDEKFAYGMDLVIHQELRLPEKQMTKLVAGDIAVTDGGDIMYHQIKGTPFVLKLGPLSPDNNPEMSNRTIPLELRLQLLTWSLTGVIFAIAVWFWVRPIWRDLETLRQTARALGDGDFAARSPDARSPLFAPLAETLNGMAERIQQLIATHRELASSVSHELRTPIARLRFGLEMLASTDEAAEAERLRSMMEQDLEELDGLIDASLTYARFEREAPEPHFSEIQFARWLEEEVERVRVLARQHDIQVNNALPADLSVELDRKAMPYALKNLLRNAMKYARQQIRVSAEIQGKCLLIHVDDDGIGIPEAERERIFSAFTRLDRSRDRATGGYGLGLAIVRRVMDMHAGTAIADASPLGGARFTLRWPLKQG